MDIFQIIALTAVVIGSYTDIKTMEVPDWLNYSLVALGLGGNLIFSFVYWDFSYIINSLLGFAVALIIGLLMFYGGQWGGGDSKMIFGLGALFGLQYPFKIGFFVKFLINMLFAGALYGLIWIIVIAFKHRKKVFKKYLKLLKNRKFTLTRRLSGFAAIIALGLLYFLDVNPEIKFVLSLSVLVLYFMNYLYVFVKIVENVVMVKNVPPEKLTEGDWIVEDVTVKGKKITGPKDLGISKKQIKELKKLKEKGEINRIKVKYGIPFVPSFLIAMIYTIITNNIILFQFL